MRFDPAGTDVSARLNPLDIAEEIIHTNEWPFQRIAENELFVEIAGRWCDYSLYFLWKEELGALYFSLSFDARVPTPRKREVYELLGLVNEKMWLGHFDMMKDETFVFRHTLPLRGLTSINVEQIEDIVETAIAETDRFYPAFQYLLWGGKPASEALDYALFDTAGDA